MSTAVVAGVSALAVFTVGLALRQGLSRPRRTDADLAAIGSSRLDEQNGVVGRSARRTTIAAGVAVATIGVAAGPAVAILLVTAAVALRRLRPIRDRRRRRSRIERELPTAMDLLVLSVRAGLSPQLAVDELATAVDGPVGEGFGEVIRRTQRGQPFADALAALPQLLGPRAGGLADVIAASERHGLPLGPTLDQLALEAGAARQRLDQADARRLPVRLSFPLVVCTLPSFVLLAIAPAMIAALSSLGGSAW